MSDFIFSLIIVFVYGTSLQLTAKGDLAFVQFYLPYVSILAWIILSIGTRTSSKFIGRSFYAKIIYRILSLLKILVILFLIGIQSYFLYLLSNLSGQLVKESRGIVLDVQENWLPFVRDFKSTVLELKLADGKVQKLSGQKLNQYWVGQEVIFSDYESDHYFYSKINSDDIGYNLKIIAKYPFSKKPWEMILKSLSDGDNFSKVEDSYKNYLNQFGYDDFAQRFANEFWIKGNLKKALLLFKVAYDHSPNNYDVLKYYGFYLLKNGNPDGEKILNSAIEINPNNFEAYYQLGVMLFEKNQIDQAYPILKRAHELNPQLSDIESMILRIEKMKK